MSVSHVSCLRINIHGYCARIYTQLQIDMALAKTRGPSHGLNRAVGYPSSFRNRERRFDLFVYFFSWDSSPDHPYDLRLLQCRRP
jgi:hypothetical protein